MAKIRLETFKRNGIENDQWTEISTFERNWNSTLAKQYPNAKQRTEISPTYNCHGLTFANRRTRIAEAKFIRIILEDDRWEEIPVEQVMPGDVVVYYADDGDANHSGVVVAVELSVPVICSKWGTAGEFIHRLNDCPNLYGPFTVFYRCRL